MAAEADQTVGSAATPGPPRHVFLTGGSSGIGFQAVQLLLDVGHRLTVLCRDAATADRLGQVLAERADQPLGDRLATPIGDLGDLASIERCADDLLTAAEPIDSLVLNAGLQYSGASEPRWSAQGFELTIAVNHLAHQVLLQRLLPLLLQGTAPRLVVTSSEVHDPTSAGGKVGQPAGLGDLAGLRQGPGGSMLNGGPFNAEKAYKDSKLCNLLMARELERRLREQGQEPRTGDSARQRRLLPLQQQPQSFRSGPVRAGRPRPVAADRNAPAGRHFAGRPGHLVTSGARWLSVLE
jgi:protochlorophyllide reductase